MSKTLSYRGQIAMGTEDRIRLRTLKGKIGYKITKFQILSNSPGATAAVEFVAKITKVKDPNIGAVVNFSDADLLAVNYYQDNNSSSYPDSKTIIFDNEMFNQDVFVNITDANGGTVPCNYYIELETMELSDVATTMLTLKNLRTVISR